MRKYPLVISIAATVGVLLVAGGAFAAGRFIITNVNQIKPSVRAQLKGTRGPRGVRGPQGPQGSQGAPGATGTRGPAGIPGITRVESAFVTVPANGVNGTFALCPPGDVVLGGGWDGGSSPDPNVSVSYNEPSTTTNTAWLVTVADHSGLNTTLAAVAECAPGGGAAARDVQSTSSVRANLASELAALKAQHP